MNPSIKVQRQEELRQIFDEALKDKNLQEALVLFEISQGEFVRALINNLPVQICSGNSTNNVLVGTEICQHG